MSIINHCEKEISKLEAEKSNLQSLITGFRHIISNYENTRSKSKSLYEASISKYNLVKERAELLENELDNERYTLYSLDKVVALNRNIYVQNEESLNKYSLTLENYEKKLRTIEIEIKIQEMTKAIAQLEKEKENI